MLVGGCGILSNRFDRMLVSTASKPLSRGRSSACSRRSTLASISPE